MKKNYKLWLSNEVFSKKYIEVQQKTAKQILPERQATICEDSFCLDEEHVKGYNGPKGELGKRGTI